MYVLNIPEMNSVCACLINESLKIFVHTRYVGVTYGNIFLVLLSSISSTAKSFFAFPNIVDP